MIEQQLNIFTIFTKYINFRKKYYFMQRPRQLHFSCFFCPMVSNGLDSGKHPRLDHRLPTKNPPLQLRWHPS